jgi:hypothetical protein
VSKSRAKKKQRRRSRAAADVRAGRGAADERTGRGAADERTGRGAKPPAQRRPSRLEVRAGVPRPDAIWAPFPLTEIGMAVGLVLFALGFVSSRPALFLAGVGVLVVVVAELCLREHFAGFRSHSILLGLLPVTVVHLGVVYLAGATWRGPLALALDLAVACVLAWWLQRRYVAARLAAPR